MQISQEYQMELADRESDFLAELREQYEEVNKAKLMRYATPITFIAGFKAIAIVPNRDGYCSSYEEAVRVAKKLAQELSEMPKQGGIWVWDDTTGRDVGCYLDGKAI